MATWPPGFGNALWHHRHSSRAAGQLAQKRPALTRLAYSVWCREVVGRTATARGCDFVGFRHVMYLQSFGKARRTQRFGDRNFNFVAGPIVLPENPRPSFYGRGRGCLGLRPGQATVLCLDFRRAAGLEAARRLPPFTGIRRSADPAWRPGAGLSLPAMIQPGIAVTVPLRRSAFRRDAWVGAL